MTETDADKGVSGVQIQQYSDDAILIFQNVQFNLSDNVCSLPSNPGVKAKQNINKHKANAKKAEEKGEVIAADLTKYGSPLDDK